MLDFFDVSRDISVIKDLTCLLGNSFKYLMKNDMLDFNVIKFFGINTRTGKVFRHLLIKWEFPSPGWVKTNIDGAARGYPGLATCGGISVFLEIRTTMVVELYGVIHATEEAQKMGLINVWLECDLPWFVLRLLLGLMFRGCYVIDEIFVLIAVGKSGLGLLILFVKGMCVLISWLI